MTARFHVNSINTEALAGFGYTIGTVENGEVLSIYHDADHTRVFVSADSPKGQEALLASVHKPRLAHTAHELVALADQGMGLTDDEARLIASTRGEG